MDWDDLHGFLMIARHGSLSAAARALRVTQSTMGRRLAKMEDELGARLLQKTPGGYVLTPIGEGILAGVERIEHEALTIERAVTRQDVRLEGLVRVTAVETFGARIVTPLLAEFRLRYPGIALELVSAARSLSLSKREADVALRLARLEQHDVVARRIGDLAFALYASKDYLAERGPPNLADGCPGHMIITLQDDLAGLPEARWLAERGAKARVAFRTNSREAQLQAAIGGMGLACLPCYLADPADALVRLTRPGEAPVREIWLGVHRDTRHMPRIRAVLDFLAEAIKSKGPVLSPP